MGDHLRFLRSITFFTSLMPGCNIAVHKRQRHLTCSSCSAEALNLIDSAQDSSMPRFPVQRLRHFSQNMLGIVLLREVPPFSILASSARKWRYSLDQSDETGFLSSFQLEFGRFFLILSIDDFNFHFVRFLFVFLGSFNVSLSCL